MPFVLTQDQYTTLFTSFTAQATHYRDIAERIVSVEGLKELLISLNILKHKITTAHNRYTSEKLKGAHAMTIINNPYLSQLMQLCNKVTVQHNLATRKLKTEIGEFTLPSIGSAIMPRYFNQFEFANAWWGRIDFFYSQLSEALANSDGLLAKHYQQLVEIAYEYVMAMPNPVTSPRAIAKREKILQCFAAEPQSSVSSTQTIVNRLGAQAFSDEKKAAVLKECLQTDAMVFALGYVEIKRELPAIAQPRKTICIDLDDTLLAGHLKLLLIAEAKIIAYFKQLPVDCDVKLITSRYFPDWLDVTAAAVVDRIESLVGRKMFSSVIYTCAYSKISAMQNTYLSQYVDTAYDQRQNLQLLDDSEKHITSAIACGFGGIRVVPDATEHWDALALETLPPVVAYTETDTEEMVLEQFSRISLSA